MSSKAEDLVIENVRSGPDQDEEDDDDEQIEESVLEGYMADDGQIAPNIIEGLRSNDRNTCLEAVTKLRQLATHRESIAIQPILDSRFLEAIVEMMCSEDAELQMQAIRIVAVITGCGSSEQVAAPVEAGALPKLIGLVSSTKSDEIRDYAFLVLGNIGGDSQELGSKLVEEGGLKPMLDVLDDTSTDTKSGRYQAASALSSYAHTNEGKIPEHEVTRMIPVLSKYILYQLNEAAESLQESLHSLSHLLTDEASVDKARRETSLIPRLVHLYTSQEADTQQHAHQCISQIILYSVDGGQELINAGVLDAFKTRIATKDGDDLKDTCFAASNIVVDRLGHAKALIDAGLVPLLVKILSDREDNPGARGNSAWTLSSLATNWGQDHHEILDTLLEANALEAFFSCLTLKNSGAVEASLKGILVLVKTQWEGRQRAVERVKAGDGIERLRTVRFRNDIYRTELHKMAQTILTDYFPEFSLPARM